MQTQIEILLHVARVLEELHIPYVVVGSVASSLRGFSRATADVDIVADILPEQASVLFDALKDEYYVDDQAMRRAILTRRFFNAIHLDSLFKVDVYILPDDDFNRQQLARRQRETLLPGTAQGIYMATAEDTILAKVRWHLPGGEVSERQLTDVSGIIKVQGGRLDIAYLRLWAERLHVRDLLEKLLNEAGVS